MEMSKSMNLQEELEYEMYGVYPYEANDVMAAFSEVIHRFDFEDVYVDDVNMTEDGTMVSLSDEEGDNVELFFMVEDDGDPVAFVVSEDDSQVYVDLGALNPPTVQSSFGTLYIDLTDLSWLNKTSLNVLLTAGDVGEQSDNDEDDVADGEAEGDEEYPQDEAFKRVVRGGVVKKIAIRKKKKRLKASTRRKLAVAAKKSARKRNTSSAKRNRAKSLKLRKQKNL